MEKQWFWKAHRNAYDSSIEIHKEFKAFLNLGSQNLNKTAGKSMKFNLSEVGGENGAKRSPPTGNPSLAPTHPHRTHDTTDQWRETVQWLGRFWRKVFLSGPPPRPTSNSHHRCWEQLFVTRIS